MIEYFLKSTEQQPITFCVPFVHIHIPIHIARFFIHRVEIFIMSKYWRMNTTGWSNERNREKNTLCFNHLFVFICSLTTTEKF